MKALWNQSMFLQLAIVSSKDKRYECPRKKYPIKTTANKINTWKPDDNALIVYCYSDSVECAGWTVMRSLCNSPRIRPADAIVSMCGTCKYMENLGNSIEISYSLQWLSLTLPMLTLISSIHARTQRFSQSILTLSCWYTLESSRKILSDKYPFARVSVICNIFRIILYWPN